MKCFICHASAKINKVNNINAIHCCDCGKFEISDEAVKEINQYIINRDSDEDKRKIANIQGWLIENPHVRLQKEDIKILFQIATPSLAARAEKILKWLEKNITKLGGNIVLEYYTSKLQAVSYSTSKLELRYLLYEYLKNGKQFIKCENRNDVIEITVTPKGHAYLDALGKNKDSQLGFCAMWFDERVKPLWTEAIFPAILAAGYEPKRIDQHEHTEGVVDEILSLIRKSRFVIADLTGRRGGVYYEAGFAKGLGIPVIFTCDAKKFSKRHFDVQHYNCLKWRSEQYEDFKNRLTKRIEAKIGPGSYR